MVKGVAQQYNESTSTGVGLVIIVNITENRQQSNLPECICEFGHDEYSQAYQIFNFVIVMIVIPLISSFGVCNNLVNVYLYTRPTINQISSSVYLTVLAFSDMVIDITGMMMFTLDSSKPYSSYLRQHLSKFLVLILPFGHIATTTSIYFTIAAAIDCFISTCWPNKRAQWCTASRARHMVMAVITGSVLYNLIKFWELEANTCWNNATIEWQTQICATEMRLTYAVNIVYNVYIHMIMMTFLPFLLLTLLNMFIIMKVKQVSFSIQEWSTLRMNDPRRRHYPSMRKFQHPRLHYSNHRKNSANNRIANETVDLGGVPLPYGTDESKVPMVVSQVNNDSGRIKSPDLRCKVQGEENTVTLVMVVILFLLCNILGLIINIATTFFHLDGIKLNFMVDISNALVIVNASANFLIYVTYDKKYRRLFEHHVLRIQPITTTPRASYIPQDVKDYTTLNTDLINGNKGSLLNGRIEHEKVCLEPQGRTDDKNLRYSINDANLVAANAVPYVAKFNFNRRKNKNISKLVQPESNHSNYFTFSYDSAHTAEESVQFRDRYYSDAFFTNINSSL